MKKVVMMALLLMGSASAQTSFRILAPATKGGGYDTLAQNIGKTLMALKLAQNVEIYNVPGEGGVTGLRDFKRLKGDATQLVVFGFTTLGSMNLMDTPGVSLTDVTPIARLVTDYEVVVVPAGSPYKTLADVVKAGANIRFGGASIGGADYLFLTEILQGRVKGPIKWVESSGNLQAIRAMYQNELDVASVSYGVAEPELKSGKLRALAISAGQRVAGIDLPTAKEQGFDAELVNWRGVFAPAGLRLEEVNKLSLMFTKLNRSSEWRALLKEQRQASFYQTAVPFKYFVERENQRVANLLHSAGIKK